MELYMNLASTPSDEDNTGGLGSLDSSKPIIELELILRPSQNGVGGDAGVGRGQGSEVKVKRNQRKDGKAKKMDEIVLRVVVVQDLESLKGRKGDTGESLFPLQTTVDTDFGIGSVLWRSRCVLD
jgi:hypothetical protein